MKGLEIHVREVLLIAAVLCATLFLFADHVHAWGWSFGRNEVRVISLAEALRFGGGSGGGEVSIDLGGGQYITTCENSVESVADHYVRRGLYIDGLDETNPETRAQRDTLRNTNTESVGSGETSAGGDEGGTDSSSGSASAPVTAACSPSTRCVGPATLRNVMSNCAVIDTQCPAGWRCASDACVEPPPIQFSSFGASFSDGGAQASDQEFEATGHLDVRPTLVRTGDTVQVYWNVRNVSACEVTSDDGDSWSDFFSGTHGKSSQPIERQTVFVLRCTGLPGASTPFVEEGKTVRVVPRFQEL